MKAARRSKDSSSSSAISTQTLIFTM
jgi:hypothetical protein